MSKPHDLILRGARLRGRPEDRFDIAIRDGVVTAIEAEIRADSKGTLDADGDLVTESFVNPHLHLCKVFTLRMMDEEALKAYQGEGMTEAMSAIELAARVKEQYDQSWILPNVRRALSWAVRFGCTHIRAFADVDSKARLEGVQALLTAREEYRRVVDLQVVAFAQDGIVREPGAAELLRNAMQLGADVVGGIPWIEHSQTGMRTHVETVFDLAQEFDADVSMLVDDSGDPELRTLEMMASEAIRRGWQGRALAHHARAMALYSPDYMEKLIPLLLEADMGVVTDPHTGPLHARVRELLQGGVLVCLGQDDITDAYYPYGRNNMLEVAFLVSHLLWMTTAEDRETLYDMITTRAAKAMGIQDFELKVGAAANLVVLDAPDLLEAYRHHSPPRHVISHGKIVEVDALAEKS